MQSRTAVRQAGKSSRKDKLAVIIQKLEDGVKDLFTSENYRNYLRTMSQFHQYSFIIWLKKFFETKEVDEVLCELEDEDGCCQFDINIDIYEILISEIISAGIALGLYYKNSTNINDLELAKTYLGYAFTASKDDCLIDGDNDIFSLFKEIEDWEESLKVEGIPYKDEDLEKRFRNQIGDQVWNRFEEQTRVDIKTSCACYKAFCAYNEGFDYSAVIAPIMKGLEKELKKYFYDGYYKYLNDEKIAPLEYAASVWENPKTISRNLEKIASLKRKLLFYDKTKGRLVYSHQDYFTIGDFAYTITTRDPDLKREKKYFYSVDEYVIEYCQQKLFSGKSIERNQIRKWLMRLRNNVESIRKIRNDSVHCGTIQDCKTAAKTINMLLMIEKTLVSIVAPDFDVKMT